MSKSAELDTTEWHPDLVALYAYWRSIAPPGKLPGRQHFDPAAIKHLLHRLWILDVQREPFRLRYRLVGTSIVRAIGRDTTGQWLDEAHPHALLQPNFLARYEGVVATGVPSRRKGKATLFQHDDYKTIENLIVPLAADGTNVNQLVVCTVYYRNDRTAE